MVNFKKTTKVLDAITVATEEDYKRSNHGKNIAKTKAPHCLLRFYPNGKEWNPSDHGFYFLKSSKGSATFTVTIASGLAILIRSDLLMNNGTILK